MAIAPRHPGEKWDLLNIQGRYSCYPKALRTAQRQAKSRGVPILIRHSGPNHGLDYTRVNQYVLPNGSADIRRDESGNPIDAS